MTITGQALNGALMPLEEELYKMKNNKIWMDEENYKWYRSYNFEIQGNENDTSNNSNKVNTTDSVRNSQVESAKLNHTLILKQTEYW